MARYEALRHLTVGEDTLAPGDIVESAEDDGRDWSAMARLGEVREVASAAGDEPRDENGDTAEMAELRKILDAAFAKQGEEVERLKADVAERDATIADLRGKLAEQSTVGDPVLENDGSGQPAPEFSTGAQSSEGNGEPMTAIPAYSVKDKGRGWFAVVKDGQEVTKSLRADDVELFPAMTADEQNVFVKANAPAD